VTAASPAAHYHGHGQYGDEQPDDTERRHADHSAQPDGAKEGEDRSGATCRACRRANTDNGRAVSCLHVGAPNRA
jgi:hypothetical protein